MSKFQQFDLHSRLIDALVVQGLIKPTKAQEQVIPSAMLGNDVQVSAATGSGKTLAYALPMMHRLLTVATNLKQGCNALVLVPTRELAQQVHKEINKLCDFTHFQSVLIMGGQEYRYQASLLRRDPAIVVATPGRLLEHIEQRSIDLSTVQFLVLDEADRMLDMGFREKVLEITGHCQKEAQTMLLSATLNHGGLTQVASSLLKNPVKFDLANAKTAHPNIEKKIVLADSFNQKNKQLVTLLKTQTYNKAIVFANKRIRVTELCAMLKKEEVRTAELHGDMTQDERKACMHNYAQGNFTVLVATDLAARGLDIEGVTLIINFDMPHSGDEYVHRIGRTGRAGNSGTAISIVTENDWNLSESIQRYLKQPFEPISIAGLRSKFKGKTNPSKREKAAYAEDRRAGHYKPEPKKTVKKIRHKDLKNKGKRRKPAMTAEHSAPLGNGMAPPKKRTIKGLPETGED